MYENNADWQMRDTSQSAAKKNKWLVRAAILIGFVDRIKERNGSKRKALTDE